MHTAAGGASASASGSVGSAATIDIKAPLWAHVNITEKPKSGGNILWKCNYCSVEKLITSYLPMLNFDFFIVANFAIHCFFFSSYQTVCSLISLLLHAQKGLGRELNGIFGIKVS